MSDQPMPLGTCVRTRGCDGAYLHGGDCDLGVIVIPLPWSAPPMTKNKIRRMHYQAEAKMRAEVIEQVRWSIKAARVKPIVGANVVLHWRVENKRRQDGDGADPFKAACIDALVLEGVLPDDSWIHCPFSGVQVHPPSDEGPATWLQLDVLTRYDNEETA